MPDSPIEQQGRTIHTAQWANIGKPSNCSFGDDYRMTDFNTDKILFIIWNFTFSILREGEIIVKYFGQKHFFRRCTEKSADGNRLLI